MNYKAQSYVADSLVDHLLEGGSISKFYRSTEWVVVGIDPTRNALGASVYSGQREGRWTLDW